MQHSSISWIDLVATMGYYDMVAMTLITAKAKAGV